MKDHLMQIVADKAGEERRNLARERLGELDWTQLTEDVHPFLEHPSDWDQLRPDLIDDLLARRQSAVTTRPF
jgi:hypothetical protein